MKFTISQSQNSLWTSCPSNPFHPHGLALNIEAINQTSAPGYQGQCNFAPKPDTIQRDLYWLIGLFATPCAGNNGVSLTGDTGGDPLKLAKGAKGVTFFFPRSLQVSTKDKTERIQGSKRKQKRPDHVCRRLPHSCQSLRC